MADKQPKKNSKTIIINNFQGKLTGDAVGDLNSGKVWNKSGSFGYNATKFNQSLTWNSAGSQLTTNYTGDLILWQTLHLEGTPPLAVVYAVGITGFIYQIKVNLAPTTPDNDAITKFTNQLGASNNQTLNYGGGAIISQLDGTEKLWIGHDNGISYGNVNNFAPATQTWTDIVGASNFANTNVPRPVIEWLGNIYAADGNNITQVSSALVVTKNKLSPALPSNYVIRDLDVDTEGRYLVMIASQQKPYNLSNSGATPAFPPAYYGTNTLVAYWNGTDAGVTGYKIIPVFNATAIHTAGNISLIWGQGERGTSIRDLDGNVIEDIGDTAAISTLPPLAGATTFSSGRFYFLAQQSNTMVLFVYDFNDRSLYPIWAKQADGTANSLTEIGSILIPTLHSANQTTPQVDITRSKIYITGTSSDTTTGGSIYSVHLQYYGSEAIATSPAGVYETQTHVFPKQVTIDEIRVYYAAAIANNSFTITLKEGNGVVPGTSVYTPTLSTTVGAIGNTFVRISPSGVKPLNNLALRLANTGTAQMVFYKIEVDYSELEK